MDYRKTVNTYLDALDNSDLEGILSLFDKEAFIVSPFLGKLSARDFFPKVIASSTQSDITVFDILVSAQDKPRAVGYFHYDWTLKDGTEVSFDCADIFEFTPEGKFKSMIILYDTYPIRNTVGDKYS